jgi:hypothetical protein
VNFEGIELVLSIKCVYGNNRAYPVCERAKSLARLMNRKSFTESDVRDLRDLGFSIKWAASEFE